MLTETALLAKCDGLLAERWGQLRAAASVHEFDKTMADTRWLMAMRHEYLSVTAYGLRAKAVKEAMSRPRLFPF